MSQYSERLTRYAIGKSYDWNFKHAPRETPTVSVPTIPGTWTYCGLPVNSPLGVAAGPLLNGDWLLYYAQLGCDLLTYKSVRSETRPCYDLPNLVPVETEQLAEEGRTVPVSTNWSGSWVVSFGMPSKEPAFWTEDAQRAKRQLKTGQLLSVSVVGTMQPGWGLDDLARDYANCAQLAVKAAGADCVEMNFSCPNVCSEDGQLFQNPEAAAQVARTVREKIGEEVPLLVKIGYLPENTVLESLLVNLNGYVHAIVTTNSLPGRVTGATGSILFQGEQRGICGKGTRDASLDQVQRCCKILDKHGLQMEVIGVGGIESAADVRLYLNAGARSVQLATSLMIDPLTALNIRQEWCDAMM